jgi:hypothetical protein
VKGRKQYESDSNSLTVKMKGICPSEMYVDFQQLQGVLSHKIVFFIATAVRTSVLKSVSWQIQVTSVV